MKTKLIVSCFLMFLFQLPSIGQERTLESRMMTDPAISKEHIAFLYANDLWVADLDGNHVVRLTSNEGKESSPHFSPDGRTITFSGEYDGNRDIYTIPVEGGIPQRITWHPADDYPIGFTSDGQFILYTSPMESFIGALPQLYKIPVTGGFPERIPLQSATNASYSPDESMIAYNPLYPAWQQWKNYRGGRVSTIWICKFPDLSVEKIPQPQGWCNDYMPIWFNDNIYFLSDRNGEFNLYSFNHQTKEIKQLTTFTDFPILSASQGNGKIIFEQAGYLHVYDINQGKANRLLVDVPADLSNVRPRYVKGNQYIRNFHISPTGARAVIEFRGEIISVPAEKGDPRNLTESAGANERSPAWSPKGDQIAWFSDKTGEYKLQIWGPDNLLKDYTPGGSGFYRTPVWSPDGKKICYVDNSYSIYIIDLSTSKINKFNTEPMHDLFELMIGNWSPDSKWIAYTMISKTNIQRVYLYSLDKNQSYPVTDGLSDCTEPVFDNSGKFLYFFGSTDAGPVRNWFDLSSVDMRMSNSLYITVLSRDSISPLAKESDEEKVKLPDAKPKAGEKGKKSVKEKPEEPKAETTKVTTIDIEGIQNRILAFPIPAGQYVNLQVGNEGEIYYLEGNPAPGGFSPPYKLHKYSLKTRKDIVALPKLNSYQISFDKKKIIYNEGDSWYITDVSDNIATDKGKLNIDAIEIKIDPMAEWNQMFNEVWRINRDYFYDPGMQGADWPAMKVKYAQFLPYLSCRDDLNRVFSWMCSELSVGHSFTWGGDQYKEAKHVTTGLLGADFTLENGRYKFKKIFGGLNWTPDLRSPLTEPGIRVKEGEYLLAVNGKDLKYPDNVYGYFENAAGKITKITVGPNADGTGSHTEKVVPIPDENGLRFRYWVEQNMKRVDEATKGMVGYVYVPNTSNEGHQYFKRYFFPQDDKEGMIIDERFNGGGSLADYYTDILRRPYLNNWATRYGADIRSASSSMPGPKVMIVDEYAGSGGDYLPWMFRKEGLGKIVGKRTWGGLVGMLGFPVLMDGGAVTAPNLAFWNEEGWRIENEGITPDIEVDQLPSEIYQGKDPQLEKAIEQVLKELNANPPVLLKRPPYPVRVWKK
jgi:tricorn protease